MIFVSIEDFYERAENCRALSREEEVKWAEEMKNGNEDARRHLIESYLPMTANHIKKMRKDMQTLSMALYCVDALEKALDSFNFLQDSETFAHRLSWYLRNASTRYIADH